VYVELLAFAERLSLSVERTHPTTGKPWGEPPGLLPDPEYLPLRGRFSAFGSPEVLDGLDDVEAKVRRFFELSKRLEEQEADEERVSHELEPHRGQFRDSLRELRKRARVELASRSPWSSPVRPRTPAA